MVSQKQKWSLCMISLLYGMSVIRDKIFVKNDHRFGMEVFPILCIEHFALPECVEIKSLKSKTHRHKNSLK